LSIFLDFSQYALLATGSPCFLLVPAPARYRLGTNLNNAWSSHVVKYHLGIWYNVCHGVGFGERYYTSGISSGMGDEYCPIRRCSDIGYTRALLG
jgi:hypothetical protein